MSKIMITICCVFTLIFTTQAYAIKVIKLNPKESKMLTNKYIWTVNATCNIQSENPQAKIQVSVLNNKSQVNGRSLTKGQTTSMSVKNNQSISVSAEPGAKVNLINLDTVTVHAVCT